MSIDSITIAAFQRLLSSGAAPTPAALQSLKTALADSVAATNPSEEQLRQRADVGDPVAIRMLMQLDLEKMQTDINAPPEEPGKGELIDKIV